MRRKTSCALGDIRFFHPFGTYWQQPQCPASSDLRPSGSLCLALVDLDSADKARQTFFSRLPLLQRRAASPGSRALESHVRQCQALIQHAVRVDLHAPLFGDPPALSGPEGAAARIPELFNRGIPVSLRSLGLEGMLELTGHLNKLHSRRSRNCPSTRATFNASASLQACEAMRKPGSRHSRTPTKKLPEHHPPTNEIRHCESDTPPAEPCDARLFAQCQHPAYNGQNKTQKSLVCAVRFRCRRASKSMVEP